MKVFYNGFNLYHQFPGGGNIVETFIDHIYPDLEEIEVSYNHIVLLVAGVVVFHGIRNETFNFEQKISRICSGENKVLVLLENGELWKITDIASQVQKLDLDEKDQIVNISSNAKLTVALTKNGVLYNVPNRLEFRNADIVDVKTGREHCLLLAKNGNVYSFGRGSRGQLGHGSLDDEPEPKFVEALGGLNIKAIEVGGWHSCALSQDGDLYVWGWNSNGQLGLSQTEDSNDASVAVMATPHLVDFDLNITKVGCGNKHTIILAENGEIYGCGWNKYKQLQNDTIENFYKVTHLGNFSKEKVLAVKCGPWNTVILCDEGSR